MPFRVAFGVGSGSAALVATVTGTVDASVQAGDVLVVTCFENSSTKTLAISGGGTVTWSTRSGLDNNGGVLNTYVWTATAAPDSPGSTITVTLNTGTSRMVGAAFAASGVTEAGVLVGLAQVTTAGTSMAFPSVTIPDATGWDLYGLANLRNATTTTAPSFSAAPAGSSADLTASTAFSTTPQSSAVALHKTTTVGSGAQGLGTGTANVSSTANLYTVGLAPAPTVQHTPLSNRARFRAATW